MSEIAELRAEVERLRLESMTVPLTSDWMALQGAIHSNGSTFTFVTNRHGRGYRVMCIPVIGWFFFDSHKGGKYDTFDGERLLTRRDYLERAKQFQAEYPEDYQL